MLLARERQPNEIFVPNKSGLDFLTSSNSVNFGRKADPFLTLTTPISLSFNVLYPLGSEEWSAFCRSKKASSLYFFSLHTELAGNSHHCLCHLSHFSCKQADTAINLLKICNQKLGINISSGGNI